MTERNAMPGREALLRNSLELEVEGGAETIWAQYLRMSMLEQSQHENAD